jgi:hypothetical protein
VLKYKDFREEGFCALIGLILALFKVLFYKDLRVLIAETLIFKGFGDLGIASSLRFSQ